MASTATISQTLKFETDVEPAARKLCGITYLEQTTSAKDLTAIASNCGGRNGSMLRNANATSLNADPLLEQIERNRKIIEQLSPVLKYKEMMRKRRARTAPRRKFSIAQGYPRINRWKAVAQSKSM
ncbi:unnamed protein product, partial [Strongylus vulgaris]